jgi:hypothetical protein
LTHGDGGDRVFFGRRATKEKASRMMLGKDVIDGAAQRRTTLNAEASKIQNET